MAANVIFVACTMPRMKTVPLRDKMSANGLDPEMRIASDEELASFCSELDVCNQSLGSYGTQTLTDTEATALYMKAFAKVFNLDPTTIAYVLVDSSLTNLSGPDYGARPSTMIRTLKALEAAKVGTELAAARNRLGNVVYITLDGHCLAD